MTRVVVSGKIHPDGMAILEAAPDLEIEVFPDPGAPVPPAALERADALLIRYGVISEEQGARMGNLRLVSRHGVGVDNLPVASFAARGIPVTIVGPVNAVSVAEQVIAMIMALMKKLLPGDRAVRSGNWDFRASVQMAEMAGKTLLLIGFGRIGREVASRATAFGMRVLVSDPFVADEAVRDAGCEPVGNWREALSQADALSLHLPLTQDTKGLIGADELAAMKPTAILINAARGGLVDEDALCAALTGPMAQGGAGLDCLASEPPPPDLPLLQLDNVVFSPHSAALCAESTRRMGMVAARNIVDGLAGRLDPALVFNRRQLKDAGYDV